MLNYGTAEAMLCAHFNIAEVDRTKFRAKLKQLQRSGFPDNTNAGRAVNAKYGPTQMFQLALALELILIGTTPAAAIAYTRRWWDDFKIALIATQATKQPVGFFILSEGRSFFRPNVADETIAVSMHLPMPGPNYEIALATAIRLRGGVLAESRRSIMVNVTNILNSFTKTLPKTTKAEVAFWEEFSQW